MELAKVQLQNQTSNNIKGPIDCLNKLYKTGGLRMCFTGLTATTLRELSFGPYFLLYATIHRYFSNNEKEEDDNPVHVIFAGGMAGIGAWISTYAAGKYILFLIIIITTFLFIH